jgi:hypothetical protein
MPQWRWAKGLRCKQFDCPTCRPILVKRWRWHLAWFQPEMILTFNARPNAGQYDKARAKWLKACVAKFRLWYRRKTGVLLPFVAVTERGEKGLIHLHYATKGWVFVPWSECEAEWERITGGSWTVNYRTLPTKQIQMYMIGYLNKEAVGWHKTKRLWCSRDASLKLSSTYEPLIMDPKPQMDRRSMDAIRHANARAGYEPYGTWSRCGWEVWRKPPGSKYAPIEKPFRSERRSRDPPGGVSGQAG